MLILLLGVKKFTIYFIQLEYKVMAHPVKKLFNKTEASGGNHGKVEKKNGTKRVGCFGKKRKITPEVIKEFEKLLPKVLFLETVAACLDIDRDTWRVWLRRGRKEAYRLAALDEDEGDDVSVDPKEQIYLDFFYCYRRAMAKSKRHFLTTIAKHGNKHWQAIAWILERRFPDEWGADKAELRQMRKRIEELEDELKKGTSK